MRGQGRVYRRRSGFTGEEGAIWWLDYSVNGERFRESSGSTIKTEARDILARRIADRRLGRPIRDPGPVTLAGYTALHLSAKQRAAEPVTEGWVAESEHHLERAITHFGKERPLTSITPADVREWAEHLTGGTVLLLAGGTVRHHLNALSNLFRRARAEGIVPSGFNPVSDLLEKPAGKIEERRWLEVPEAALFLEAARTAPAEPAANGMSPISFGYPLIATFLLTGGRQGEVLGLEVADVDFDRDALTFRPNTWRRLKTRKSHRTIPLWPQLEDILRAHVFGGERPPSRLLFPSYRTGGEQMLTDVRKLLDRVTEHAGALYLMDQGRRRKAEPGEVRTKVFRHTYITARLQTIDHGAPVSPWSVAREVGHSSMNMIEQTYGHLGAVRHRAAVVEYRVEQQRDKLGDRLERLRGVLRHTDRHTLDRAAVAVQSAKPLSQKHKRQ